MNNIYFDNNATTQIAPEVFEAMLPYLKNKYGNPGSVHSLGKEAQDAIKRSRTKIAKYFGVKDHEVLFTSGATESINTALKGYAYTLKRKGKRIITSPVEHKAVLETCKQLEGEGYEIVFVDVNEYGQVDIDSLVDSLNEDTIIVSIMHVNNELGSVNDIAKISSIVKKELPEAVFFSDGVQALGKLKVDISGIDSYAISGHKMHAPKGVGALVVREENVHIKPLIYGGGQEFGMRSGTENVSSIVGLAKAAELAYEFIDIFPEHFVVLRDKFVQGLNKIENLYINSSNKGLENIVNASFLGIPSEVLMRSLDENGLLVSAGSACTSKAQKGSHVLNAIGLDKNRIESSLRFSFSRYTTIQEIEASLKIISETVYKLRNMIGN